MNMKKINGNGVTAKDVDILLCEICDWLFAARIHYLAINTNGLRTCIAINTKDAEDVRLVAVDSGWPVQVLRMDDEISKVEVMK